MPQTYFQFKRFKVHHAKSAMKVGTDGVLLGAWAGQKLTSPHSILDVGTGTGLIAMMLAQRFPEAKIQGVEIQRDALEEATANVQESPFAEAIALHHADFLNWSVTNKQKFDLVVSNPPFFEKATPALNHARATARHSDGVMPLAELAKAMVACCAPKGEIAVILPPDRAEEFIKLVDAWGFGPHRITKVQGQPKAPVKRWLVACSSSDLPLKEDHLVIEETPKVFTPAYMQLTKAFYLNF